MERIGYFFTCLAWEQNEYPIRSSPFLRINNTLQYHPVNSGTGNDGVLTISIIRLFSKDQAVRMRNDKIEGTTPFGGGSNLEISNPKFSSSQIK